jgi:hypothetical protein
MRFSKRAVYVVVMVAAVSAVLMALTVNALGARGSGGGGGNDKGGGNDQGHNGNGQGNGHGNGNGNGNTLLRSTLAPSVPGDPTFHGVNPGGAPWVLQRGEVRLKRNGQFRLRLRGLVIPNPPGDNTPGPVTTVNASLYCGADSDTTAAATTDTVPISRQGDANINTTISVPATCLAPLILVHPNGIAGAYISLEGWR